MAPRKDLYATLSIPGTKKISVCARRIGSKERLAVIATCNDEGVAEKIVDALNLLQGEVSKLELPIQKQLDDVRASLQSERAVISGLHTELSSVKSDKYRLEQELKRAILERDRAIRECDAARAADIARGAATTPA